MKSFFWGLLLWGIGGWLKAFLIHFHLKAWVSIALQQIWGPRFDTLSHILYEVGSMFKCGALNSRFYSSFLLRWTSIFLLGWSGVPSTGLASGAMTRLATDSAITRALPQALRAVGALPPAPVRVKAQSIQPLTFESPKISSPVLFPSERFWLAPRPFFQSPVLNQKPKSLWQQAAAALRPVGTAGKTEIKFSIDEFKMIERISQKIANQCPKEDCLIVGLGRSPTPIIGYMQVTGIADAINLPFGRNSIGIGESQREQEYRLFKHYEKFLTPKILAGKKSILVIDFTVTGGNARIALQSIQKYFEKTNSALSVSALAILARNTVQNSPFKNKIILDTNSVLAQNLNGSRYDLVAEYDTYDALDARDLAPRKAYSDLLQVLRSTLEQRKLEQGSTIANSEKNPSKKIFSENSSKNPEVNSENPLDKNDPNADREIILIGFNSEPGSARNFTAKMKTRGLSTRLLHDLYGEFENQNSYVELFDAVENIDSIRVADRDVAVIFPQEIRAETLMETLIRIRAAKTFGARSVRVYSDRPLEKVLCLWRSKDLPRLNLRQLIKTAGATHLEEDGKISDINTLTPESPGRGNDLAWFGGGENHPELFEEVRSHLSQGLPEDSEKQSGQTAFLPPVSSRSFQELRATPPEELRGRRIYWLANFSGALINEQIFKTLTQISWMKEQGMRVHLISPYLPYGRSDKPDDAVRGIPTVGKLVAELIQDAGTESLSVVRPHSSESVGFYSIPVTVISEQAIFIEYLKKAEIDCIVAPDAGFEKEAFKYQKALLQAYGDNREIPVVVMNKKRIGSGQELVQGGQNMEYVRGRRVAIVDDETASGGTLRQVAETLQKFRPISITAAVTHLAGTAKEALESNAIQSWVVTNTLPAKQDTDSVTVLSIAGQIAETIQELEGSEMKRSGQ